MVKTQRCYQRLGGRYIRIFVYLIGLIGVAIISVFLVRQFFPDTLFRTNILLVGNPMLVVSYDTSREHIAVIQIPADMVIKGINGVGQYSLESLWKLGTIDKQKQHILIESLSESLGVLITWFVGPKGADIPDQTHVESVIRNTFSYGGFMRHIISGRISIPLGQYFTLVTATANLRVDAFKYIDLDRSIAIVQKEEVDGTTIPTLDEAGFDTFLGTVLEEDAIRKESLRVAIYNTTDTPTLGARVERKVNKIGALVVEVGNDTPVVDTCIVSATEKVIKSFTVRYMVAAFGCKSNVSDTNKRADIEMRIGRDYQRRFLSP